MTSIINIVLIVAAVLLMLPLPLKKTTKLLIPVLVTAAAVLCTALVIYNTQDRLITVTALSEKNASAESDEVWLRSVTVNGVEFDAESRFSGNWVSDGGTLIWRSYDAPEGMTDSVRAVFPRGSKVELIFQTNRWRGKAQVRVGSQISLVYGLDLYADTTDQGSFAKYTDLRTFENISLSREARSAILTVGVTTFLLTLSIYGIIIYLKKIGKTSEVEKAKGIIKKGIPLTLAVLALVLAAAVAVDSGRQKTVTITALDQKNPSAEGTEIWIASVLIDGVEAEPDRDISGGWIYEEGYLKWRAYDRPDGLKDSISLQLPEGGTFDIIFQTNRWRGKAEVETGGLISLKYCVDCYTNSGEYSETADYLSIRSVCGVHFDLTAVLVVSLLILTAAASVFIYFRQRKKAA